MARKVIGIVCYCSGGFFLFTTSLLSFLNPLSFRISINMKLLIISIFLTPAIILIGAGLILRGFQRWRRDVAVVLLASSGHSIFIVFSLLCMILSPEYEKLFPNQKVILSRFNDYFTGALCILIFICFGLLLLVSSRSKPSN